MHIYLVFLYFSLFVYLIFYNNNTVMPIERYNLITESWATQKEKEREINESEASSCDPERCGWKIITFHNSGHQCDSSVCSKFRFVSKMSKSNKTVLYISIDYIGLPAPLFPPPLSRVRPQSFFITTEKKKIFHYGEFSSIHFCTSLTKLNDNIRRGSIWLLTNLIC